ncbi:MAG: O-antigen ligase family protein [Pseudomonadota bacterium]
MAAEPTPWSLRLLAAGTILASVALLILSDGNLLAALMPSLVLALGVTLLRLPFPTVAAAAVLVALLVDDVRARPYMGLWESPLFAPGRFVYDALDKITGVPGLKVFGVELMFLVLLALLLLTLLGSRQALPAPPRVFARAALIAVAAVLLLELWGLVRGGNLRYSMLQMRPMLLTGLGSLILGYAAPQARNARLLLAVVVIAAVVRSLVGLYFWSVVVGGADPEALEMGGGRYLMTHADTVLLVVALLICLSTLVAWPTRAALLLNVAVTPLLSLVLVLNNRRLAFVSLGLSLLVMYALLQGPLRRRVNQLALALVPIAALYLVAGWNAQGLWAKPVISVRSLLSGEDASASMRTIENYNLVHTARKNPVLGSGFGHEYDEVSQAFSIETYLEAYRYMPHNSLLWLVSVGGVVGFSMFWWLLVVGVFLAALVQRHARTALDLVVAQSGIAAIITYGIQCFGDMGMQSWLSIVVLITLLGLVASRATALEVWPEPHPGRRGA